MATQLTRETAAQAWCAPTTSNKVMDVELAEAFAEILDEIWSKPWLGNATTDELLSEIRTRIEMNGKLQYKTVGCHANGACIKEVEHANVVDTSESTSIKNGLFK